MARAVGSSSPSVRHVSPDTPARVVAIRPHAHVAAGVSVFVRVSSADRDSLDIRFDLSRNIVRDAALTEDKIVAIAQLHEYRGESEITFVLYDATAILARRDHSRAEIRRKLARRGYRNETITWALEQLAERSVQDDRSFAQLFIEQRMRRRPISRRALCAALQKRGIARELAEEETMKFESENPDCFERALEEAIAKMKDRDRVDRGTITRRLLQRGFLISDVERLLP